ncbi:MAG: class I SAM-dependent methyltransferase [Actinomycetota bacterium]
MSPRPKRVPKVDPKTANILYHDAAARSYDDKWSISFDERCVSYVRDRAERMLPEASYDRVLEIGSGTGFFLLNLWQAGFVKEAHATDISPGMLQACGENARRLGLDVKLRTADAEGLPFEDGSFDLVVGHAFLHHLPEWEQALRDVHRVLAPGGAMFFAGEPTRLGDRMAGVMKRATAGTMKAVRRVRPALVKPPPPPPRTEDERILRDLEFAVDLHTFDPAEVERTCRSLGFTNVRTETEELTSSLVGWAVRTFESQVRPGALGERWGQFAYRSYLRLYDLDQRYLYRVIPKRAFYNLLLYAEKPGLDPKDG